MWPRDGARVSRDLGDQLTQHVPSLLRTARRLTKSAAEAEDLVQETLMRAVQRHDELRDPSRARAWLLAIQRNLFLNSRRGLRPRLEVLDGDAARGRREPAGDLELELLSGSLDDELYRALDALPEDQREALWLREVEELTYDEIASVQSCPIGTVRSRLARARSAMIELVAPGATRGSDYEGM
jgi:RNA polymerase sigma-70 factor (ECF subfamily)